MVQGGPTELSSNLEKLAADLSQSSLEGILTVEMLKQMLCECRYCEGWLQSNSVLPPFQPLQDPVNQFHTCLTYIRTDTPP